MSESSDGEPFDDEFAVLPPTVEEAAVPAPLTELAPWHTPRKQFVREFQWLEYSSQLIRQLRDTGGGEFDEVRYLCLPGRDYLDVELLANTCRDAEVRLTHTGFLSVGERTGEKARAEFRQQRLVETGLITARSQTFWRPIEEVANGGTIEHQVRGRGPFHIINLDACGSLRPVKGSQPNLIGALQRLIEMQVQRMPTRWLLLLTADVRADTLHEDAKQGLIGAIMENARESDDFKERITGLFPGADDLETAAGMSASKNGLGFVRLFSLGIGKWLLHLVQNRGWTVKMQTAYCYTTQGDGGEPTMPCLAFEFIPLPQPLEDAFDLAGQPALVAPEPGEDHSIRIANKTHELVDLDARMNERPELRSELAERLADQLARIGYTDEALAGLRT